MSVLSMAAKALENPEKVPPYLRRKAASVPRKYATKQVLDELPSQRRRLDDLRAQDEFLLVVLDACRYTEFMRQNRVLWDGWDEAVATEGHDTFQWLQYCWPDQYPNTVYVSGATPVASARDGQFEDQHLEGLYDGYCPPEHIGEIVDVWDFGWDRSLGTVPPERVIGETLDRLDEDRLVAHLFQPHAPYIGDAQLLGHTDSRHAEPNQGEPMDKPLWEAVKAGEVTDTELRRAYRSNLERALESVCWLADETDRTVYILGDHGEALGEYDMYSHPRRAHPEICRVPFARIDTLSSAGQAAADRARERFDPADQAVDGDVAGRLRALGYAEEVNDG